MDPKSIKKVGVVGAGAMGSAIAEVMLLNGYDVVVKDIEQAFLDKGRQTIEGVLTGLAQASTGRAAKEIAKTEKKLGITLTDEQKAAITEKFAPQFTEDMKTALLSKLTMTTSYDDFADVDLVIESALEVMSVKKDIFRELEKVCRDDVILGTNTSALPISEIASAVAKPERVIGVHFFNPPYLLPLIELIPAIQTDDAVTKATREFSAALRNHRGPMVAVTVRECPGFLVNRILAAMMNEAFLCYEEGIASAEDLDTAIKAGLGHPMGPLELADMVGIDIIHHMNTNMQEVWGVSSLRTPIILKRLFDAKRYGKKTGKGFYDYS